MFSNGRKTIGVFICRTANYYQRTISREISRQATSLGYNVAFFSCFGNYVGDNAFGSGETRIIDVPEYEEFAGVILALDTFDIESMREDLVERIKKRCKCPVVCVREACPDFYNLLVDDSKCLENIIKHFVEVHKFHDICFVSGPVEDEDARLRLDCFKRVMKQYNLETPEENIFYGDFWKFVGPNACDKLIYKRKKTPQAIICANDYMAISVCSELVERGIRIPDDVTVSGYDGIWETTVCAPSLTTVKVPMEQLAIEAVNTIDDLLQGKACEKNRYFPVEVVLRESCGCKRPDKQELAMDRKEFYRIAKDRDMKKLQNVGMMVELEDANNNEDIYQVIHKYRRVLSDFHAFHLCQHNPFDKSRVNLSFSMIKEDDEYGTQNIEFTKEHLLPKQVTDALPQSYFFLPFHFKEKDFGYVAVSFNDHGCYGHTFQFWLVNVENAMEDIRIKREMNQLISELEEMYVRDALTGLFNRRGFENQAEEMYQRAIDEKKFFFIVGLDLDRLKYINDTFGHVEGDVAINAVSRCLLKASKHNEVCARMGGDEFSVAGVYDCQEDAVEFIHNFEHNLMIENDRLMKNYEIMASHGEMAVIPSDNRSMEYYMNVVDAQMYERKRMRKEAQ